MTIAQEEIFGPVLSMIGYEDDEDAVRIANDTLYGLSGYISSGDQERATKIARLIRTGNVHVNGAGLTKKRLLVAISSRAMAENGESMVSRSSLRPKRFLDTQQANSRYRKKRGRQCPLFFASE